MDSGQSKNADPQFMSFHDFPSIDTTSNVDGQLGASTQAFNNLSNDSTGIGIVEDLQGMPDRNEAATTHNFWTIEYYQKFFNVSTNDVLERLKRSMIPHGSDNYLITHIRPNPDLYGPFWICITLVFSIAITGNMANYLQTANSTNYHWKYDFHVVSYAATCIFLYAWLLPVALWGALKWSSSSRNTEEELIETHMPGLLELLCLYGYSLAIYIPVTFLWTIQISWLQWCFAVLATVLSGGVLLRSLLPVFAGKHRIAYVVVILGMHLLLAAGFMLYFYHVRFKTDVPNAAELIASTTQHAKTLRKVAQNNSSLNVAPTTAS